MGSILGQNIKVDSRDNVLNLTMRGYGVIGFAGCTADASLMPSEQSSAFCITNFNKGDLLAIGLCYFSDTENHFTPYILEIEEKDGKPFIDLEKPESEKKWMPRPDRLIQIIDDGYVRVMIGNQWYSNNNHDKEKGCCILPVSAGNLMVKYAYGLAEAEEIINLTEEIQLQADAVELLEIQAAKNGQLHYQIRELENQICTLTNNLNSVLFSTGGTIYRMKEIERSVGDINSELGKTFPGKKSIRQSLSNISTLVMEVKKVLTEKP